jgi:aspartate-semialdehyde dehydrogenase
MGTRIAIVGATGNVGRELLAILDERMFPADEVYAVASRRSLGKEVSYGDRTLKCQDIESFDFSKVDLVLMSAGGSTAKQWCPKIAKAGAITIDNSDPDVPLVVPEVNPEAVDGYAKKNIIANPNCSTAQMVVALKPLHDRARSSASSSRPTSPSPAPGRTRWTSCGTRPRACMSPVRSVDAAKFTKQIAFNVIPHIDKFMEDGSTKEEWKMVAETKKIVDPKIKVTATCVRVPVFVGHSEAINIEFEEFLDEDEAREILREAPGILVVDKREDGGYVTPVECVGDYATFISRIRQDSTSRTGSTSGASPTTCARARR